MTKKEKAKRKPDEYYVDVLIRVHVKCKGEPEEAVNDCQYLITGTGSTQILRTEMMDVQWAGDVGKANELLHRGDDGTGRDAIISHGD